MARVVAPNCWHHVTQRGNRQQPIFFDDTDRTMYLRLLTQHCGPARVAIAGYCLMGNHVHLIAIPQDSTGMAKALGRTHGDYARWLNLRLGEVGHLWQNRFFSCVLDERHQWEALRYVERNPVRAGMVRCAADWPWSSARAHLAGFDRSHLLEMSGWANRWDANSWGEAWDLGINEAALVELIRAATRAGGPIGSAEFTEELETRVGRLLRPRKRGPKAKTALAAAPTHFGIA